MPAGKFYSLFIALSFLSVLASELSVYCLSVNELRLLNLNFNCIIASN